MKDKRKFTKSLIRPIFNALIGLIVLLSFAIGTVGYLEFSSALKEQYAEIANGIAEYVSLQIDAQSLDGYLESKTADEDYNAVRDQLQRTADAEDCKVVYVAKVHTDTKEREYIYNVVSKTSGYTPYAIGHRDYASEGILNAYGALINGELDVRNLMYTKEGYTTSVYPVKDSAGKVVAIVGVVKDMTLLNKAKSNYILQVLLIETAIAVISGIIWVIYMRRRIVTPIRQLNQASLNMVEHLADGTSPEIVVKRDDEIKDLADCFSTMYREIGEYISQLKTVTAEKERIGAELDVAAKIQSSMLPCIFPPFPNRKEFDIYATMDPAKEVGGDFYDFFMVDEDHLAFVVADVSGKGVPAALFMVIGKTLIKDHTGLHNDLGEVITEVNNILCASNSEEMFITAFEGVLNLKTGELRYVNAGHETPFICRGNGVYEKFKVKSGFVLAGMEGVRYKSGSVQLEPGDKIFEYSDGVPEAANANNEQYSMKRLADVLAKESKKMPTELLPLIKSDLDEFVGGAEQFDDITMLCVQFNGTGRNAEISVKPDKDCLQTVAEWVENTMDEWQIPVKTSRKVQIAVDEIFSNIVNYSGANNAKLTLTDRDKKLLLTFEDDGIHYDPTAAKEPDITLSAEDREVGGLGIFIVKKMATDVRYEYVDGKNLLTVETAIDD